MGSMQWQLGREMGTIPTFASRTQENQENLCPVKRMSRYLSFVWVVKTGWSWLRTGTDGGHL